MTPYQRAILHTLAGLTIPAALFSTVPHPWNVVLGSLAAAIGAGIAFLDQSLSQ